MKNISRLAVFPAVFCGRSNLRKDSSSNERLQRFSKRLLTYLCLLLIFLSLLIGVAELSLEAQNDSETQSNTSRGSAPQKPMAQGDFQVRHVRVFDGEHIIGRSSVLVRNGKIKAVGLNLPSPKGVRVIDVSGHTLLPGLIDAHTHVLSRQGLEQSLAFGVTTDLSMLMDLKLVVQEKMSKASTKPMTELIFFLPATRQPRPEVMAQNTE